jgi:hypothetical protein
MEVAMTQAPAVLKYNGLTFDEFMAIRGTYDRQKIAQGTVPDLPVIKAHIEWAEDHPEEWAQEAWGTVLEQFDWDGSIVAPQTACKTAYCIGGHALVQNNFGSQISGMTVDFYWPEGVERPEGRHNVAEDGALWHVSPFAAWILGLTNAEAAWLFDSDNQIPHLWAAYEAIEYRADCIKSGTVYSIDTADDIRQAKLSNLGWVEPLDEDQFEEEEYVGGE